MNKYKNKKCKYKGIYFDSIAERNYYLILLQKYKKEEIKLQPKFELQEKYIDNQGKNVRAINYVADFQIGNKVIDLKGVETKDFLIKEKLFKKKYQNLEFIKINAKTMRGY